jgi:hypothetical protein
MAKSRSQLPQALHIHADANAKRTKSKSYQDKNSLAHRFLSGLFAPVGTIHHSLGSTGCCFDARKRPVGLTRARRSWFRESAQLHQSAHESEQV